MGKVTDLFIDGEAFLVDLKLFILILEKPRLFTNSSAK